jgi:hypothetical protein
LRFPPPPPPGVDARLVVAMARGGVPGVEPDDAIRADGDEAGRDVGLEVLFPIDLRETGRRR